MTESPIEVRATDVGGRWRKGEEARRDPGDLWEEVTAVAGRAELATPGASPRPRRRVAVLSCMDTRIDLLPMFGLRVGDAHLLRNAGGLVTDDVIRSLSVSRRLLGTRDVFVVMHEGCGLHGASEDDFTHALARDGALPSWRVGAFEDLDATVRHGLARLRVSRELALPFRPRGFVFDPETGALREVAAATA